MHFISHSDPAVLEQELLGRVADAKRRDPLARLLIVVPTKRLADHVARRIAVRLGAAVGIDIVTHRVLAAKIVADAGRPLRVADASIEDALLARVLDRASPGSLRDFVRERPVARPALARSMKDLRDAAIEPRALPAGEVREIYARWTSSWDELARDRGLTDEAGLARAAAAHARDAAARYAAIFHHGAYELIGVHDDLVRAMDAGREGVTLRPGIEEGAFPDLRAKTVRFADAQGSRPELGRAVAEVLGRIAAGEAPEEHAIVVRSFGPYASAVEALLREEGPAWHTSFVSAIRRLPRVGSVVAQVNALSDRPAARWSEHAGVVRGLLGAGDDDVATRLTGVVEAMSALQTDLGDEREIPAADAAAFFTARVDATTIATEGHDAGGPRLLDAMQARGMTFDHVALVGLNSRVWPRVPGEDPFLSDTVRRRLRVETGRPIPIRLDNAGEERLLLAMTLGSARRSIDVSWRRADDQGRPVVESLALRNVRRAAEAAAVAHLPTHPRKRLEVLATRPGVLRPEDELLLVAFAAESGADAATAVVARRPELASGVALVGATESFSPKDPSYDGRTGASREARAISVSKLETLARCPLQFFFEHRLGIDAVDRAASPYEPSRSKLGVLVHKVLQEVYARLMAEALFDEPLAARRERAGEILRQAWAAFAPDFAATRARPLPVVDRVESEVWLRSLGEFVVQDLERMEREGSRPVELEAKRRSTERVPGLPPLTARLDRIVEGPDGRIVGDYKTGGDVDAKIKAGDMLKGKNLQVAVYALMEGTPVDVLGVGPDHEVRSARFHGFKDAAQRDGVLRTVRTVAALLDAGAFPMVAERHCSWCAFRSACRRSHPPSEFREEHASDTLEFRSMVQP